MQTTQPLLLKPRRLKIIGLGIVSLAFVIIGVWMLREVVWLGWQSIGFFGLCLLVSMVLMLPNASYLELNSAGFTMCSLFRAHTILWVDVSTFGVGRIMGNKMVMFNFVDSYQGSSKLRTFNTGVTGFEAGLPDSYGLKHDELAELMNKFKAASNDA